MMKLSFDKRLDEDIMKAYCTDFQIIETRFINSSEFSSLRLRWETAVALQAETEQAEHADISSRKGSHGKPCILYFQVCRGFRHSGAVQVCLRRNKSNRQHRWRSRGDFRIQGKEVAGANAHVVSTVRIFPKEKIP